MTKQILTLTALSLCVIAAEARRGGDDDRNRPPRREWVSCHIKITGVETPLAATQADIVDGAALLRGEAQGLSYVLSVRGKSAVARLSVSKNGPALQASGSIELLRGGGLKAAEASTAKPLAFKRGDDDDRDDEVEREAGVILSYSETGELLTPDVQLICDSQNERINR